jgi:hypothetical protein
MGLVEGGRVQSSIIGQSNSASNHHLGRFLNLLGWRFLAGFCPSLDNCTFSSISGSKTTDGLSRNLSKLCGSRLENAVLAMNKPIRSCLRSHEVLLRRVDRVSYHKKLAKGDLLFVFRSTLERIYRYQTSSELTSFQSSGSLRDDNRKDGGVVKGCQIFVWTGLDGGAYGY